MQFDCLSSPIAPCSDRGNSCPLIRKSDFLFAAALPWAAAWPLERPWVAPRRSISITCFCS